MNNLKVVVPKTEFKDFFFAHFREFELYVRKIGIRLGVSSDDIEEAFLHIIDKLENYDGVHKVSTFVSVYAGQYISNKKKRKQTHQKYSGEVTYLNKQEPMNWVADLVDKKLIQDDIKFVMEHLMGDALEDKVLRCKLEGMTEEQIGDRYGLNTTSVRELCAFKMQEIADVFRSYTKLEV